MNTNEVIARRAMQLVEELSVKVHPNDHINFGQSSNDTFPTAIRIAGYIEAKNDLVPSLKYMRETFLKKGSEYSHVVKTGRTHLMDAMPVTFEQEFGGYARQIEVGIKRIETALSNMAELPMGGTAVGTGINTHPKFPAKFAAEVEIGRASCRERV